MTMMATAKEVTMMMTMMILMILAIVMTVIAVKMVVIVQVMPAAALHCHRKSINVAKRDKQ